MSSKLLPDEFASRCAFSSPPQPSPVDVLSACNVATGTPVSAEILSRFAPREAIEPKTRTNAAVIKPNAFICNQTPFTSTRFGFGATDGSLMSVKFVAQRCSGRRIASNVVLTAADTVATTDSKATHRDQYCLR